MCIIYGLAEIVSHATASSSAECSLDKPPSQLCQWAGTVNERHCLWLSTGTQVIVDLSQSLLAGTAMTLRSVEEIEERLLSLREVKLKSQRLSGSWPSRPNSSLASTDLRCPLDNSLAMVDSWMTVAVVLGKWYHGELASCHQQLLSPPAWLTRPSFSRAVVQCLRELAIVEEVQVLVIKTDWLPQETKTKS